MALETTPEVSKTTIDAHETAAFIALWFMELTGALAWLGLWQYRRLSRLPQGTLAAVLLLGLVTFGLMARAANIGGEIRHPEIRDRLRERRLRPSRKPPPRTRRWPE